MNGARLLIAGALALALAPLAPLARFASQPTPRPAGPVLVLDGNATPDTDAGARATTLVLRSLSKHTRTQLAAALDDLATGLEAKANPLVEDFLDEPPNAALDRLAPIVLPALTAAQSLSSRRFEGASLAAACPPSARCVPLSGKNDGGGDARFHAWAWSNAIVLHGRTPAQIERMREHVSRPESRIALVVAVHDLARGDPEGAAAMRANAETARRILARTKTDAPLVALLARPPIEPSGSLGLPLDAVLVVPKLSALADPAATRRELDAIP